MSAWWRSAEERLIELLADQAVFDLDADGRRELNELLETMPEFDTECMERTAALVELASLAEPEPMPIALRESIRAEARRFLPR